LDRRSAIAAIASIGALAPFQAAVAQQEKRVQRIGVITAEAKSDPETQAQLAAFLERLKELGWKVGADVRIEYRFGEGDVPRLPKLARELVDLRPDVIFAPTTPAATAVRQLTLVIPIVFAQVPDPVAAGFVTNLARPNGNITGFTNFEFSIGGKWVETIKACAPKVSRAAVVFDPANPSWTAYLRAIEASAPNYGLQLTPAGARNVEELEREIEAFARTPNGALIVLPSPVTIVNRKLIISLAAQHHLPAIYPYPYFTKSGGLMSFGINVVDLYARAASYVDRILKGAKPVDLPIQLPTRFELVINLKTAKALGLTIPKELLLRADEVIQ
jgi:putative ABC transport system substrate-binding protein